MQKSKNATIGIIVIILIYGIIASIKLSCDFNAIYLNIINPFFWIILSIFLKFACGKQLDNSKIKRTVYEYCFIGALAYILIYILSGLFLTYGKNPYSTSIKGLLLNVWIMGIAIIGREYVRYKLINNVYAKDKVVIAVLISIVYILIDLNINNFLMNKITILFILKIITENLIPLIAKNLLYSYTAMNVNYIPTIIYEMITNLFMWISPILPNVSWIISCSINTAIPVVIFVYVRYIKNKKDIFKIRENILSTDPKNIIELVILVILAVWFSIGIFPFKPVAIATGSMEPNLNVGDIVIIKKCKASDIIKDDIVEYQMKGYTVVHRAVNKKQVNGDLRFITKGDNNDSPDVKFVDESQIIGKCVFRIKYLGYPAIWLHLVQQKEAIDVETGK